MMSSADESSEEKWSFQHSVECHASKSFAWQFWTNVANWPVVDSSAEAVELDGPFAAGAKGITKPRDLPPVEWQIIEVQDESNARIEILAPGAVLKCLWRFETSANGSTLITQRMSLEGEKADEYVTTLGPEMERGIPQGMRKLADAIAEAASHQA